MNEHTPWCPYGGKAHGPMTRSGRDWVCFACGRRYSPDRRQLLWEPPPRDPVSVMNHLRRMEGARAG